MQKWKQDPELYGCDRDGDNRKKLDYYSTYVKEFLSSDPLRDWESIERCKELWNFFIDITVEFGHFKILDAGTKDGQFPKWRVEEGDYCIGIEIDDNYVEYAQSRKRPVIKGDVCNIKFDNNIFDIVFSHHVLGLCPSYFRAYNEMLRVCKPYGYVVTLADVPGNPKKHYSMVFSVEEVKNIIDSCGVGYEIVYMDYWHSKRKTELVTILRKS